MQIGRLKARLKRSKTKHILNIVIPVKVGDGTFTTKKYSMCEIC
jgi:hypothetical protein